MGVRNGMEDTRLYLYIYMVRKKIKRRKMRSRAGKRAWDFKIRAMKEGGGELVREYRSEMKKRIERRELSGWKKKRKEFLRKRSRCEKGGNKKKGRK